MKQLFQYNWMVRDEWFEWCQKLPEDELLRERTGGVGSILRTLFHIIDVETSWIRALMGAPDIVPDYKDYMTLEHVRDLSDHTHHEIKPFIDQWDGQLENKNITVSWDEATYTYGEVIWHVIAHEIHHIGQLSVWAKELNLPSVSSNFIGRGLGESIIK